jgi:hypothetical protein
MAKTLERRVYDGDKARQVLENEAFAQAFEDIEREYIDAWKNSPARDEEGREKLFITVKLLHKLRVVLEATLDDGRLAYAEMEHNKTKLQRAKEWISGQY